jgi:A/G-specific adenine glycosylase
MATKTPSHQIEQPLRIRSAARTAIGRCLAAWYAANRRDLPWRQTTDPYGIWISEVMLQQTQVKSVLPYYQRFIRRFPDVFSLSRADFQTVLKLWQGLGYYSRARNMHKAAGIIVAERDGKFPDDWKGARQLPGIGDYIASAVLSIAFGRPHAVADGNVKRVLGRLLQVERPVNLAASHRLYRDLATRLLDREHPGDHNQAMMELGALVCTPRKPDCPQCPVSKFCRALKSGVTQDYPKRIKRLSLPQRHVAVGVVQKKGRILLVQRSEPGLLGGFWEFPGGAVGLDGEPRSACAEQVKGTVNLDISVELHVATVGHTYTHFKLRMEVYLCRWHAGRVFLRGPSGFKWLFPSQIDGLPLHGAMIKALKALSAQRLLSV